MIEKRLVLKLLDKEMRNQLKKYKESKKRPDAVQVYFGDKLFISSEYSLLEKLTKEIEGMGE